MKNRPLIQTCLFAALAAILQLHSAGAQTPSTPAPAPIPAPAAPAAPALVPNEGVIKLGKTLKQTRGRVTDVDKGDNGCYITLRDDKKNELIEVGSFAICTQKPPIKGKLVELTFNLESIQAGDCYGDPKCKRTEEVPLVTSVKIIE